MHVCKEVWRHGGMLVWTSEVLKIRSNFSSCRFPDYKAVSGFECGPLTGKALPTWPNMTNDIDECITYCCLLICKDNMVSNFLCAVFLIEWLFRVSNVVPCPEMLLKMAQDIGTCKTLIPYLQGPGRLIFQMWSPLLLVLSLVPARGTPNYNATLKILMAYLHQHASRACGTVADFLIV